MAIDVMSKNCDSILYEYQYQFSRIDSVYTVYYKIIGGRLYGEAFCLRSLDVSMISEVCPYAIPLIKSCQGIVNVMV